MRHTSGDIAKAVVTLAFQEHRSAVVTLGSPNVARLLTLAVFGLGLLIFLVYPREVAIAVVVAWEAIPIAIGLLAIVVLVLIPLVFGFLVIEEQIEKVLRRRRK